MGANLTYLLYSAMWKLVRLLPERAANRLFQGIAAVAYKRNQKRVQRLRQNYRQVRPGISEVELEELVKSGLRSAMRYWCETFRISDWNRDRIIETVTVTRENLLTEAIAARSGLIIALPHAGNWDHAGLYFCTKGITVNTVAEHLKPERLFQKFLRHREAMGMRVLDLAESVSSKLEEILESGGLVALVADRDLSKSGIPVDFFGATAKMPPGPALLAIRTGAPLITAYVAFTDQGIHIEFNGPFTARDANSGDTAAQVAEISQQLANQFARDITENLSSWHMQQRIFVDSAETQVRNFT